MLLRKAKEGVASVGAVSLEFDGKAALITQNTIIGSPLYVAGLDRGDQIVAIDRLKVQSQEQWDAVFERYQPGDSATIHYIQREVERSAELTFEEVRELEVVTFECADRKFKKSQLAFRTNCLGPDTEPDEAGELACE